MPRGGPRAGAGRPKGARSRSPAERLTANRLAPLDHMLAVLNDPDATPERRDQMAIAAAPYVHPIAKPPARSAGPYDQFLPPEARDPR